MNPLTHSAATPHEFDVVVVGSGAAGMTAALTASIHGLNAVVLEKEPRFGGTTAISGGWLWIPMSPQAMAASVKDDAQAVRTYLQACARDHYDGPRVDAFIEGGPQMVRFMESNTEVRFELGHDFPDYHPGLPGGVERGRSIVSKPMPAAALGDWLPRLAPALRELSFLGMVIGSGTELKHFFNVTRSPFSAWYATRRLLKHAWEVLRHGRGMTLVNGNALAASLGLSLQRRGIPLWVDTPVRSLTIEEGRVTGVVVQRDGEPMPIRARRAVILATGGFAHDVERRRTLFPHAPTRLQHWSLVPAGNVGDGLRLGESAGGSVGELPNAAAWVPVSRVPRADGSEGLYPHFVDRGKPGIIAVRRDGRRFVNEANSYHDFVQGLYAATPPGEPVEAFFICDHPTIRRYGLGAAKPFPVPLRSYLRSGYLKRADTLEALAARIGIPAAGLRHTVDEFNGFAREGRDHLFQRGESAYNRFQGDAKRGHPSLAPIATGPFYAVQILPGSLGTYAGLRTDAAGRVLNAQDGPVPGVYAVGNDMLSVMGGDYPGGGTTLGPAMTFGYLAALDIARAEQGASTMREPAATASPTPQIITGDNHATFI